MKPANTMCVVITAYNSEKYIAEAVECVLRQTCLPDEIIVIDDGSTDNTRRIVEAWRDRVKYIYQVNSGVSVARNNSIARARSEIVSFLDADDLWLPDKLLRTVEVFDSDPGLDMAFTYAQNFYSPELDLAAIKHIHGGSMEEMPGHLPSAFSVKKESFARVGPFDDSLKMGEFIDWYGRAKELRLQEAMISQVLVRRRLHTDNLGISKRSDAHQDYLKIIRKKLKKSRSLNDTD